MQENTEENILNASICWLEISEAEQGAEDETIHAKDACICVEACVPPPKLMCLDTQSLADGAVWVGDEAFVIYGLARGYRCLGIGF